MVVGVGDMMDCEAAPAVHPGVVRGTTSRSGPAPDMLVQRGATFSPRNLRYHMEVHLDLAKAILLHESSR